jgi:hypothetical protein
MYFMINLHTIFHMFSSKDLLIVAVLKPKAKYSIHAVVILLFYVVQKKLSQQRPYMFSISITI